MLFNLKLGEFSHCLLMLKGACKKILSVKLHFLLLPSCQGILADWRFHRHHYVLHCNSKENWSYSWPWISSSWGPVPSHLFRFRQFQKKIILLSFTSYRNQFKLNDGFYMILIMFASILLRIFISSVILTYKFSLLLFCLYMIWHHSNALGFIKNFW